MITKIHKSNLNGTIRICPSKSYEQRAWAISALMHEDIIVHNSGNSADVEACRNIAKVIKSGNQTFNCGESALCARMFPPIIALNYENFTIKGEGTLTSRNIDRDLQFYEDTFGWKVSHEGFRIHISNAHIAPGNFTLDGSHTSQIITGLILALSTLVGNSSLTIENPTSIGYILMTIDVANEAGAEINYSHIGNTLRVDIKGAAKFSKKVFEIEGDWSNAAFLIVAGLANGNISISGLNPKSLQPDRAIIDVLDLCRANYEWGNGNLIVHKSHIGKFNFDATDCPDLIPPLCALALNANGKCKIKGTNRLIGKESNRLEAITEELAKLGAVIEAENNSITINPSKNINSAVVDSHNDHRIAMMLAVLGLSSDCITIHGSECVNKSYPEFFDVLKSLGAKIETLE